MKVGFIRQAKEPLITDLICLRRSEADFWSRRLVRKGDFEICFCTSGLATHMRNILGSNRLRDYQLHSLGKVLWRRYSIRRRRWKNSNSRRNTVQWHVLVCITSRSWTYLQMVPFCVWVQWWNREKRGPRQELHSGCTILESFIQQWKWKCKQGSYSRCTSSLQCPLDLWWYTIYLDWGFPRRLGRWLSR